MDAYNPGDIIINNITMTSSRGTLALDQMFATCKIFESIYNPNAILELQVWDTNDTQGYYNIVGDEQITMSFQAPGGTTANYTFNVDTISNTESLGTAKSKLFTLHGVGTETFYSKTNFVQKAYNTDIASIVQDIHSNYLMSQKPLSTEPTSGTQSILIPNY
ncbi:MAG: hypothetical protein ACYDBV_15090, partial [Nitrospiria bacterium]